MIKRSYSLNQYNLIWMNRKFKIRNYDPSDHAMISEWWEEWGWKPVPPSFLPAGFIVEDDEGPLYVAFVYMTGTGICWLEWLLTSKKIDVSRKRGAKEFLIGKLESMLRATGVEAIFTTSNDAGLVNGLKKCGFEISDTNMVQMIKILK